MATYSNEFLTTIGDYARVLSNQRIILCYSVSSLVASNPAAVLAAECINTVGGYSSQSYTPSAGSISSGQYVLPNVSLSFQESGGGTGYQFNYVAHWQGRSSASNVAISSINTSTNRLTVSTHGLTNGDKVVIATNGVLPAGISTQFYYAKSIDANTIELYQEVALTTIVDITDTGTGSHRLCYGNGQLVRVESRPTTTIPTGQTFSVTISWAFGSAV